MRIFENIWQYDVPCTLSSSYGADSKCAKNLDLGKKTNLKWNLTFFERKNCSENLPVTSFAFWDKPFPNANFVEPPQFDTELGGGLFWSVSRRKMGVRKSFFTRSYLIIFVVQGWKRITKQKVTHVSLKIFEFSFFPFVPAFRRFCTTNEISTHIFNEIELLSTWKYAQLSRKNLCRC